MGKVRIILICTVSSTNSNDINFESAESLENSPICSSSSLVTLSVPKKQYITVLIAQYSSSGANSCNGILPTLNPYHRNGGNQYSIVALLPLKVCNDMLLLEIK